MTAVWVRVRTELRVRRRAVLGLALIAGLAGGLVMAAAAGARRTDTAITRFRAASNTAQVFLPNSPGGVFGFAELDFDVVERLPQVAESARSTFIAMTAETAAGVELTPLPDQNPFIAFASHDGRYGRELNRLRAIEGRLADPRAEDEVVLSVPFADAYGVEVGEVLPVRIARFDDFGPAFATGRLDPSGPSVVLRVVGVAVSPGELPPGLGYPSMHLTPAFHARFAQDGFTIPTLHVRLHRDADVPAFRSAIERDAVVRIAGQDDPQVQFASEVELAATAQRTAHLQAVALWLLMIVGALVAALVIGQALTRQASIGSVDHGTLAALGMTRAQIATSDAMRAAITGVVAAVVGSLVAIAASPVMPIGIARLAEPSPGVHIDALTLALGGAAMLAAFVGIGAVGGWLFAGAAARGGERGRRRTSAVGRLVARAIPSVGAVVGARLALEPGRGRTALPVRSTMVGVAAGIAALTVAFSFGASFDDLLGNRVAFGWTWDAAVGNDFDPDRGDLVIPLLREQPGIAAFAGGTAVTLSAQGRSLPVVGLDDVQGRIEPRVVEGRAPTSHDEIALGARSMRVLGARVGSTIDVSGRGTARTLRVVGRVVVPPVVEGGGLGEGAIITFDGLRRFVPGAVRNLWVYRLAAGADGDAIAASVRAGAPAVPVIEQPEPQALLSFGRVDRLPVTLAGIVALFAAATLAHTMGSAVRRRRRDLAILKTLGFVQAQVRRAVAWQASTLATVGLAIGIPAGLVFGRWSWTLYAGQQGFASDPRVPVIPVALLIPATIALANLIAAMPGRRAARTVPAAILRAE